METISLKNYFPAFVSSRKSIKLLKENVSLNKEEKYIVDFSGITFVSRSFADELIKFFANESIVYELTNLNNNLKAMFNVVSGTQKPRERHFDAITVTNYKSGYELNCLLDSL